MQVVLPPQPPHPAQPPHSPYATMDPTQVADEYVRRSKAIHARGLITGIAIAVIAIADLAVPFLPSLWMLAVVLAVFALTVIYTRFAQQHNFQDLQNISAQDCTPAKQLAVCKLLKTRLANPSDQLALSGISAVCAALAGQYQEALELSRSNDSIEGGSEGSVLNYNAQIIAYRGMGNYQALQDIRYRLSWLLENQQAARSARTLMDSIDVTLAIGQGNWQQAVQCLQKVEAYEAGTGRSYNFMLHVTNTYRRAQIAFGQGDIATAGPLFWYVATYGGELDVAAAARSWIAAYPPA